MKIKNYTSTVPVGQTVARIEQMLAEAGASGIMKDYTAGKLTSLSFRIATPTGKAFTVRLPANAATVCAVMLREWKKPTEATKRRLADQSERTAWKLIQDWVAVQLSLIHMEQADVLQVFMPYVWDGEATFYERVRATGYKQLPMATGS